MEFILLLSPIVLLIYLIWCYQKIGMTTSFSATYKKLEESGKDRAYLPLTYLLYVAPIVLYTVDRWFIASGLLFMLVASNPVYWKKSGISDELHYVGSYGAIILGYTGLMFMDWKIGGIVTLCFVVFAIAVTINLAFFKHVKHETYWMEAFAAFSIPLTVFFLYLFEVTP